MKQPKPSLPFVIVVEGKSDSNKLKQLFDVETIETTGSAITSECLKMINNCLSRNIEVVFLLDPDVMGNKIRQKLNLMFPNVTNAFVQYKDMIKDKKKIGIAETRDEILMHILTKIQFKKDKTSDLIWQDMLDLDLIFNKELKQKILDLYHLPSVNNKTFFKYLRILKVTKKELKNAIDN